MVREKRGRRERIDVKNRINKSWRRRRKDSRGRTRRRG